jgi:hypothetical protein
MNGNGSSGLSRMEYSKLRIASSKFPVELNVSQFGRLKTPNGNVETPGKSTKARHWWAFPALPQWPSRTPDCVAGDAVLIAPVSNGIPCKQGILQGIPRNSAWKRRHLCKKCLSCSDFPRVSLLKLSGKFFLENRDLGAVNREIELAFSRDMQTARSGRCGWAEDAACQARDAAVALRSPFDSSSLAIRRASDLRLRFTRALFRPRCCRASPGNTDTPHALPRSGAAPSRARRRAG